LQPESASSGCFLSYWFVFFRSAFSEPYYVFTPILSVPLAIALFT